MCPTSLLDARPSMLPLYHITQPPSDINTISAPVYTSRSPKSLPFTSSGTKTPTSKATTPSRSKITAKASATLQWDRPVQRGGGTASPLSRCQWTGKAAGQKSAFDRVLIASPVEMFSEARPGWLPSERESV
ncbi:hypothetical protein AOLI_G00315120 [Acnodon oligacanthus]